MHKVCHVVNDDQHQGARKEQPDAKAAFFSHSRLVENPMVVNKPLISSVRMCACN
jgi:hypothetical protein